VSSKKPSSTPDDLFRSIPPAEQFHAFPPLDAFPADAIAFLTGRSAVAPRTSLAPKAPTTRSTKPHSRPVSKPHSKPLSQSPDHTLDQSPGHSASHTATLQATLQTSHTQGQSLDHTTGHTLSHSLDHTLDQSPDRTDAPPPSSTDPAPAAVTRATGDDGRPGAQASGAAASVLTPAAATTQDRQPRPAFTPTHVGGDPGPASKLNDNQRRILTFLLTARPYIITFSGIAAAAGMGEASVRTILRRLAALDFLTFRKARDGNLQGVRIAFNQELCAAFRTGMERLAGQDHTLGQSLGHTPDQSQGHTIDHSLSQTLGQPDSRPHSEPHCEAPLLRKIEGIKSFLPGEDTGEEKKASSPFADFTDAFLSLLWPRAFEAGFRQEELTRAAQTRIALGKPLDRDMVALSLDRADWELEKFGCLSDLASGEKVRNPQAYLFTALARWGVLRPHPEYVSREEELAAQAAKELEKRREADKILEEKQFSSWRESLDEAALEDVMRGFPGGPREVWIKNHWRKHVQPHVGAALPVDPARPGAETSTRDEGPEKRSGE